MKQMDALQKLEQYVNMPSGSADLEGLAAFVSVVEKDMQAPGFTVTRHPMAGRGDALECVYGDGEDTLLLIGHMDTVFPVGEGAARPFAVDENGMEAAPVSQCHLYSSRENSTSVGSGLVFPPGLIPARLH